jgi:WhiB family redox-sensing transcriptional regulator
MTATKHRQERTCLRCGGSYTKSPHTTWAAFSHRRYCGTACSTAAQGDRARERALNPPAPAHPAIPRPEWMARGACRSDEDPELWYPSGGESEHDHNYNRAERDRRAALAKAICGQCPVRTACLRHALAAGERFGIWGGLDASQRAALVLHRREAITGS